MITGVLANDPGGLFNPSYKRFYVQRVGRIIPLFLFMVLLGFLMNLFAGSSNAYCFYVYRPANGSFSPGFWASIMTFTFNWFRALFPDAVVTPYWSVLWSLCVEEQFYLFFPALLKRVGTEKILVRFLVAFILFAIMWRFFCFFEAPILPIQLCVTFGSLDCIAMGVLLFLVNKNYGGWLADRKNFCYLLMAGGLALVAGTYLFTTITPFYLIFTPTLITLGLALFLLGGLRMEFFQNKNLRLLGLPGKFCYGGYLLHMTVYALVFPFVLQLDGWTGFAILAALVTIISGLSYHFFEMPVNYWIRSRFLGSIKAVE